MFCIFSFTRPIKSKPLCRYHKSRPHWVTWPDPHVAGCKFVLNTCVIVSEISHTVQTCLHTVLFVAIVSDCVSDYLCWFNCHQYGRLVGVLLISISHRQVAGRWPLLASTAAFQALLMLLMSLSLHFRLLRIWFVVHASQYNSYFHVHHCSSRIILWFREDVFIYLFMYSLCTRT